MTILITGGATRLGKTLALQLAAQGQDIALHYHTSHDAAHNIRHDIMQMGRRCEIFMADLRDTATIPLLFKQVLDAFGTIDCLLNNAAIFNRDTLETLTPALFHEHQTINLLAPLLLIKEFSKQQQGCIINILDQKVHRPDADFLSYTLSKIGLTAATKMLAVELAPSIRVNGIALGAVIPAPTQRQSHFDAMRQQTPLKKGASLEDVMLAVDYLRVTTSVTGEILTLDGGASLV